MDRRSFLKALGGAAVGLAAAKALPVAEPVAAASRCQPPQGLPYLVHNSGTYCDMSRTTYGTLFAGNKIDVYSASDEILRFKARVVAAS